MYQTADCIWHKLYTRHNMKCLSSTKPVQKKKVSHCELHHCIHKYLWTTWLKRFLPTSDKTYIHASVHAYRTSARDIYTTRHCSFDSLYRSINRGKAIKRCAAITLILSTNQNSIYRSWINKPWNYIHARFRPLIGKPGITWRTDVAPRSDRMLKSILENDRCE